jgi:uncharacterized protein
MWTDRRGSEQLSLAECHRLLAAAAKRGLTGRVGVSTLGAPIVHPVNFGYHDHRVVIRIGPGHLADALAGALVAFEVDDVDRHLGTAWSVVVRGTATRVLDDDNRVVTGSAPAPIVPAPGDEVFLVHLDVVTGRRFRVEKAVPRSAERRPRNGPAATPG